MTKIGATPPKVKTQPPAPGKVGVPKSAAPAPAPAANKPGDTFEKQKANRLGRLSGQPRAKAAPPAPASGQARRPAPGVVGARPRRTMDQPRTTSRDGALTAVCLAVDASKKKLGIVAYGADKVCQAYEQRKTTKGIVERRNVTRALDVAVNTGKTIKSAGEEVGLRMAGRRAYQAARQSARQQLQDFVKKGRELKPKAGSPEKSAEKIARAMQKQTKKLLRRGQKVTDKGLRRGARKAIQRTMSQRTPRAEIARQISGKAGEGIKRTGRLARFLKRGLPFLRWGALATDVAKWNQVRRAYMKDKASFWKLGAAALTAGASFVGLVVPWAGHASTALGAGRDLLR